MKEQYIDLHVHSTSSDGTFSPSELVILALKKGLKAFALTDHDTTAGIGEAQEAARGTDLTVFRVLNFLLPGKIVIFIFLG